MMMTPLSQRLCAKVVHSLDHEIIVLDSRGAVSFANRRASETFGTIEENQRLSTLFRHSENGASKRLRRIAQSSIWAPVNFVIAKGPHRGIELKFRGRGFTGEDGTTQILLVASRDRDKGFEQLRKLVRELNCELAERQQMNQRLERALPSEERLHRELIHRVKNNLGLLSSLISTRRNATSDENVRQSLEELEHRVQAVAAVHELLDEAGEIDRVLASDLIRSLCHQLEQSICPPHVEIQSDLSEITLHVRDATPLSLLVNELITNALKHAFPEEGEGVVRIDLKRNGEDKLEVNIADNGRGMESEAGGEGLGKPDRQGARPTDGRRPLRQIGQGRHDLVLHLPRTGAGE
ncbi:MAG: sensor histidine kinase [Sphingomonadaceae bacterium]